VSRSCSTASSALAKALNGAGTANAAIAAMVLILAAVSFKLAAFPFHSWAPDAYETASAPVAAFLASAPKLAALASGSVLLMGVFGTQWPRLVPLAAALAVASIVFGNLGALKQVSLRRMLAYSGIAQVGYALVAFASGGRGQLLIFGVTYTIAAAGAFIAAEAADGGPGADGSIASLAGLGATRPVVAASLAVCLLSLTGIPLTAGFWGKVAVFGSATTSGSPYWWLAIVGVLGSVVSFGYYGGVLRVVYLDTTDTTGSTDTTERSRLPVTAAVMAAALVLALGVAPLFWGRLALFMLSGS
jgi:NADH-quinone oxidoreductase subunit N